MGSLRVGAIIRRRPDRPERRRADSHAGPTRRRGGRPYNGSHRSREFVKLGTRVALSLGPVAALALAAGLLGWLAADGAPLGWGSLALGLAAVGLAGSLGLALVELVRTAILQVRDALTVIASSAAQFVRSSEQYAAGAQQQAAAVGAISE